MDREPFAYTVVTIAACIAVAGVAYSDITVNSNAAPGIPMLAYSALVIGAVAVGGLRKINIIK